MQQHLWEKKQQQQTNTQHFGYRQKILQHTKGHKGQIHNNTIPNSERLKALPLRSAKDKGLSLRVTFTMPI